jgi:hypothetical protein
MTINPPSRIAILILDEDRSLTKSKQAHRDAGQLLGNIDASLVPEVVSA